jgi:hypothetical protein
MLQSSTSRFGRFTLANLGDLWSYARNHTEWAAAPPAVAVIPHSCLAAERHSGLLELQRGVANLMR